MIDQYDDVSHYIDPDLREWEENEIVKEKIEDMYNYLYSLAGTEWSNVLADTLEELHGDREIFVDEDLNPNPDSELTEADLSNIRTLLSIAGAEFKSKKQSKVDREWLKIKDDLYKKVGEIRDKIQK